MNEQLGMFDKPRFHIGDKKIRLIELFAGIGAQAKAFENLGVDYESYAISEWDYHAVLSYYAQRHKDIGVIEMTESYMIDYLDRKGISSDGKKPMTREQIKRLGKNLRQVYEAYIKTNNLGSILNIKGEDLKIVDTDKYCYLMFYSFPCQDLSIAGKGAGMSKGTGTRSGLLWEVERILDECTELPQVLIMENVPQVHSKKNIDDFNTWIKFLESKGYSNYYKDLNAKNFGIPQNRNRTFMVSILGDYSYEFPKEFPLELRLKDVLDPVVEEKYYLSDKATEGLVRQLQKKENHL